MTIIAQFMIHHDNFYVPNQNRTTERVSCKNSIIFIPTSRNNDTTTIAN